MPLRACGRPAMQYFVVMIDYGRRGREAIVDPEITRREVISRVASGEYNNVSFIHEIADSAVDDVTAEILAEAAIPEIQTDRRRPAGRPFRSCPRSAQARDRSDGITQPLPRNFASIARRVLIVSLSASTSTSLQRTAVPWATSFFSLTRCARPSAAHRRQGCRGRHEFAPYGIASLAVQHFAGAQVALGD